MLDKFPLPHRGLDISRAKFRGDIPQRTESPKVNHWLPLHRYAVEHVSDWNPCLASRWYFEEWKPRIPTYGCACEKHWKELTEDHPPDFSSPQAFFEWGYWRHDDVSRLHSKRPQISLEQAYAMYWPSP